VSVYILGAIWANMGHMGLGLYLDTSNITASTGSKEEQREEGGGGHQRPDVKRRRRGSQGRSRGR
jgi:hypothetical protein